MVIEVVDGSGDSGEGALRCRCWWLSSSSVDTNPISSAFAAMTTNAVVVVAVVVSGE